MVTKDYASGSVSQGSTFRDELEYLKTHKPNGSIRPVYLITGNTDLWRKRVSELMEPNPLRPTLLGRLRRLFSLPSAWRS